MVLQTKDDARGLRATSSRADRPEVEALYQDILINVTSFFRDPEVFEALKACVFPEIVKGVTGDAHPDLGAAGCSTGEEAYSLAIALLEFLERQTTSRPIQIFATDINEAGAGEGPCRALPREHRGRRLAGAAAALLHQGGRQVPDQQVDPRHVRLRPAERGRATRPSPGWT